jgi:protocatechuate 3,4-dioxygenase beta subunit
MRNVCLVLSIVFAGVLDAASLRGIVVENQTGKPLSQTLVAAQPVEGSPGQARSVRSNYNGYFEFPPMPTGVYLLTASRPGFITLEYGQKSPQASGTPITLDENSNSLLEVRMKRFGAIAGTITDGNDVGIPDMLVVAYRNKRPPELIGKAITDDRGVYRIPGLLPGSYLVRSAAKVFFEERYLPTFSRQATRVDEALPADVQLDDQADATNVKATSGRLFEIGGRVYGGPAVDGPPVTLTLISDMGRESITTNEEFRFHPVAPGPYEIEAQTAPDRRFGTLGGYMPLTMDNDRTDIRLGLNAIRDTAFYFDSTVKPINPESIHALARKKDLAGLGPVQTLNFRAMNKGVFLGPGRWELELLPMADFYVSAFSGPGYEKTAKSRPDGWNEIVVGGFGMVRFTLTSGPGTLSGTVVGAEHETLIGAPVFLEAYDPEDHRRLKEISVTRTDVHGGYRFQGLAPGTYRVMSSFDYQIPGEDEMSRAEPPQVKVEAGRTATQDLMLYVPR